MTNIDEQNSLFMLIGETLRENLECFVIGGSAMLYYGAKTITKDIDIVFSTLHDRRQILEALRSLGFKERPAKILYFDKKNTPILMERGNERLDLFYDKIIDMKFTDEIKKRASKVYEFGNLIARIISPEDILMLKCATERAGDRKDAYELILRFKIDWDIIIKESLNQTKIGGDAYPVYLFDFILELKEDLKTDIPDEIIVRIRKIAEEVMDEKIKSGNGIRITKFGGKDYNK